MLVWIFYDQDLEVSKTGCIYYLHFSMLKYVIFIQTIKSIFLPMLSISEVITKLAIEILYIINTNLSGK